MIHIFIINSHAGYSKFSAGLRNHLAKEHADLDYHIFHTKEALDERRLMAEVLDLFGDEKLRIYCCGGLGTLNNLIHDIDDFSNLEFAYYAKGFSNDFLQVFGSDAECFKDIDKLIAGEAVNIDYIKTNHGNCLNNFSLGLDSQQVVKMTQYRDSEMFGIAIPYILGFFYAILFGKPEELEIVIDDSERIITRTSETFFGNGGIIGGKIWFDPNPNITDGLGKVAIYKYVKRFKMIPTLVDLAKKDMSHRQRIKYDGYCSSISIKRRDGSSFVMNYDGEIQEPQREWKATIVKQAFPFVIPKGVKFE